MSFASIPIPDYVIAGVIIYLFCGGMTYELIQEDTFKEIGAIFWPIVWSVWIIVWLCGLGPRFVRSVRARRMAKDAATARIVNK